MKDYGFYATPSHVPFLTWADPNSGFMKDCGSVPCLVMSFLMQRFVLWADSTEGCGSMRCPAMSLLTWAGPKCGFTRVFAPIPGHILVAWAGPGSGFMVALALCRCRPCLLLACAGPSSGCVQDYGSMPRRAMSCWSWAGPGAWPVFPFYVAPAGLGRLGGAKHSSSISILSGLR